MPDSRANASLQMIDRRPTGRLSDPDRLRDFASLYPVTFIEAASTLSTTALKNCTKLVKLIVDRFTDRVKRSLQEKID